MEHEVIRARAVERLREVVAGKLSPRAGAAEIWVLLSEADYPVELDDLRVFVGLISEIQDDPGHAEAYGAEIVEQARRVLAQVDGVRAAIVWGPDAREEPVVGPGALDALLDQAAAAAIAIGKPQDVQLTVASAGTLGMVVGAHWSVLNHVPADLDPPYRVSVGDSGSGEILTFYVAGDHHTEALERNAISPGDARAAMQHFLATGELSPRVTWEEI